MGGAQRSTRAAQSLQALTDLLVPREQLAERVGEEHLRLLDDGKDRAHAAAVRVAQKVRHRVDAQCGIVGRRVRPGWQTRAGLHGGSATTRSAWHRCRHRRCA